MLAAGLVASPGALPQSEGTPMFVSDEITLSVRERPSNEAGTIALVSSGEPVTMLRSLGEQSFAEIRTEDGLTGWVTARYLTDRPAARDQLDAMRNSLDTARRRIADLEARLAAAQRRLQELQPAFELQADNDRLRQQIADQQRSSEQLLKRYDEEKARRQTLIMGALLVGGGVLAGLVLPWIGGVRRRRSYGDL